MVLRDEIPQMPELALANYSFVDIVSGMGIIEFYAGTTNTAYVLRDSLFYSNNIAVQSEASGIDSSFSIHKEVDFDATINRNLVINGDVLVNVTGGYNTNAQAGPNTTTIYIVSELEKVSGGVTTSLGSDTSSEYSAGSVGGTSSRNFCMKFNVTNQLIKRGDILRLNIKLYAKLTAGSTTVNVGFGTDPKDRNDDFPGSTAAVIKDADTTQLILQVPVKIDL